MTPTFDPTGVFSYGKVNYDQVNGLGSVPWNQDVVYRGITTIMIPHQFITMAAPSQKENPFLIKWIEEGKPIGAPFLYVDYTDRRQPFVLGHEGRHRVLSINKLYGSKTPIVVQIFFRSKRAASFTDDQLTEIRLRLLQEKGAIGSKHPRFSPTIHHMGKWKTIR